jgi:hypothetical protein
MTKIERLCMSPTTKKILIISSIFLAGCSSVPYEANYPMTEEVVRSLNDDLQLRVPKGWFATTDENNAPNLLVWLVREDYGATMAISEIKADAAARKQLTRKGLEALAEMSFALKSERAKGKAELVVKPKEFKLDGRKYCSYEYSTDGRKTLVRVVVFDTGKHFYDFTVVPAEKQGTKVDPQNLFLIQQSVLSSLQW